MSTSVIQIQGENVSYTAKGDFIRRLLVRLGLREGGVKRREAFIAEAAPMQGHVAVLADAYHLDEDRALAQALNGSHLLLAPSALCEAEAAHAQSLGATILLPASQQKGFEAYIAKGTVVVVQKIPAVPLADALEKLEQDDKGRLALAAMRRLIRSHEKHSFIYPPGHFSDKKNGGKVQLTARDIEDMIALIEAESAKGVLVICGGRVVPAVVEKLQENFAAREEVVILSQNEQVADLPSAYTKIVHEEGRVPNKVLIDILARTTMEVVVEASGLAGAQGLCALTSEGMIGDDLREQQAAEYYGTYGATQLLALGRPWRAPLTPAPVFSAPDLETALRKWMKAKGLIPLPPTPAFNPQSGPSGAKGYGVWGLKGKSGP